jgi:hypothetical protein
LRAAGPRIPGVVGGLENDCKSIIGYLQIICNSI